MDLAGDQLMLIMNYLGSTQTAMTIEVCREVNGLEPAVVSCEVMFNLLEIP